MLVVMFVCLIAAGSVFISGVFVAVVHAHHQEYRGEKMPVRRRGLAGSASVLRFPVGLPGMKAIFYEEHGSTDVLQYGEFDDPEMLFPDT